MVVPRSTGGVLATAGLLLLPLMVACAPQEGEEDVGADTAADTMATGMAEGEAMASADPFEGEHPLPGGRTVQMEDGEYTVQSPDSVIAEGMYDIRGDTVILVESTGPCTDMRGVYTFTVEGGELATMNLVEDPCEVRRQDITSQDTASQPSM